MDVCGVPNVWATERGSGGAHGEDVVEAVSMRMTGMARVH